jgi:hypothetical protein
VFIAEPFSEILGEDLASSHFLCVVQLEVNERVVYDKKRKLRQAIESGKPIPTELREEVTIEDERSLFYANMEQLDVQMLEMSHQSVPS